MESIFLRPCMVDWKFLYSTFPLSWWGIILEWQSFFLRILKILLHLPLASSITFEKPTAVLISDPLLLFENSVTVGVLKFQGNFFVVSFLLLLFFIHWVAYSVASFIYFFDFFLFSFWITYYSWCWTAWIDSFVVLILSHSHFLFVCFFFLL